MSRRPDARALPPATGIRPEPLTPAEVGSEFRSLLASGLRLAVGGRARARPARLLTRPYLPRHVVRLFDARFYLSDLRYDDHIGFLVGHVLLGEPRRGARLWTRLFYKDSSLVWRVATHVERHGDSLWIGKGDTRREERDGWEYLVSVEETANLPHELHFAFDAVSRARRRVYDPRAIELVVRRARRGRLVPFADFLAPRRAAARRRVHGGKPVAWFTRPLDPTSLVFAPGYEPDFRRGLVERGSAHSAYYGGEVQKLRLLSRNRRVQYLAFLSPTHAWFAPPQSLARELTSYGVRPDDVLAAEEAFLPAFEYHDEAESQIPRGFAGAPHPEAPERADASAWLEGLPIVRALRRAGLARPQRRASSSHGPKGAVQGAPSA